MIHIGRKFLGKTIFNSVSNSNNIARTDITNKITEINKIVSTLENRVLTLEKQVVHLDCAYKNNNRVKILNFDKDMPLL